MTRAAAGAEITAHSANWRLETERFGTTDVPVPYAVIGDQPDTLLLTGLGETDITGIAESLAERDITGLAVASLVYPPEFRRLEDLVVEQSILAGTTAVATDMTGGGLPLKQLAGNSQGANQAVLAAYRNPGLAGEVIAVAPGFNAAFVGSNPKDQVRGYLERFKEAGLADILFAADGNDGNGGKMGLIRDMLGGLAYAQAYDNREVVRLLGDKLRVYLGEDDPVVPPEEYVDKVSRERVTTVPDMGHVTLLDETGCDHMAAILRRD